MITESGREAQGKSSGLTPRKKKRPKDFERFPWCVRTEKPVRSSGNLVHKKRLERSSGFRAMPGALAHAARLRLADGCARDAGPTDAAALASIDRSGDAVGLHRPIAGHLLDDLKRL